MTKLLGRLRGRVGHIYPLRRKVGHIYVIRRLGKAYGREGKAKS